MTTKDTPQSHQPGTPPTPRDESAQHAADPHAPAAPAPAKPVEPLVPPVVHLPLGDHPSWTQEAAAETPDEIKAGGRKTEGTPNKGRKVTGIAITTNDDLYAVCDDGSVWVLSANAAKAAWSQLPLIPTDPNVTLGALPPVQPPDPNAKKDDAAHAATSKATPQKAAA